MEYHGFTNGLVLIAASIGATLVLVSLVRRLFSRDVLREAHDVTGNLLAVVGTLYAVLLGLIVVDALVRFEHATDVVRQESNSLADIFLLAQRLPAVHRDRLQAGCKQYAKQVVDDEWPLMAAGRSSMAARKTAFELTKSLEDFEPRSESEKIVFPLILEQIRQLWDYRRERVGTALYGIPEVEWFVLIVGGIVTMLFAGLFRAESVGLQRLVTSLAALLIALNLYLVALFGYPFAGELTVSDRPFRVDIAIFDGRYDDTPAHEHEHPHR